MLDIVEIQTTDSACSTWQAR